MASDPLALIDSMSGLVDAFNEQKQQIKEDEEFIREEKEKLQEKENKLIAEARKLEKSVKKFNQISDECDEIKTELCTVTKEIEELKAKKRRLTNNKISPRDEQIMEQGIEKLNLYKSFSGIRWNMETIENRVSGYVTNKKDYIQSFDFPKNTPDIPDKMWERIEKAHAKEVADVKDD